MPGFPVAPELFVGRAAQLEELRRGLAVARSGRASVMFLQGGRGMGKTSLASFFRTEAERDYGFLAAHVHLGGAHTIEDFIAQIFDRLLKDNVSRTWFNRLKEIFGSRIRQVELFGVGVEFAPAESDLASLRRAFPEALDGVIQQLRPKPEGLLLVLDDINGLAGSADFANWFKSVLDQMYTSGPQLPLFLLFVGYPERREALVRAQPSLGRLLEPVVVSALREDEQRAFLRVAFRTTGIRLTEGAEQVFVDLSGGLPTALHELGQAALDRDDDGVIDEVEARTAARIAASRLGARTGIERLAPVMSADPLLTAVVRVVTAGPGQQSQLRHLHFSPSLYPELRDALAELESLGVVERTAPDSLRFTSPLYAFNLLAELLRDPSDAER